MDVKGAFVGLLKRPFDGNYPNEDVGSITEVLVDERLRGLSARLHRLKALHGVLEDAGEVLDVARSGVGGVEQRSSPDSLSVVP